MSIFNRIIRHRNKSIIAIIIIVTFAVTHMLCYERLQYYLYQHGLTIPSELNGYLIQMPPGFYPSNSSEIGLSSFFSISEVPTIRINKLGGCSHDGYILLSIRSIPINKLKSPSKHYSWGDMYIVNSEKDIKSFVLNVNGFVFFGVTTDITFVDEIISIKKMN